MISPEILRRYPFFRYLGDSALKSIAMLADEVVFQPGATIFKADEPADALYLLAEGSVDLHYSATDSDNPDNSRTFYIGPVNPGEPLGISALIEPYRYTTAAIADGPCRLIRIDAAPLRALCAANNEVGATLMRHTALALMSRLRETRVLLVASRA